MIISAYFLATYFALRERYGGFVQLRWHRDGVPREAGVCGRIFKKKKKKKKKGGPDLEFDAL